MDIHIDLCQLQPTVLWLNLERHSSQTVTWPHMTILLIDKEVKTHSIQRIKAVPTDTKYYFLSGINNSSPVAVHMETLLNSLQYLWSQDTVIRITHVHMETLLNSLQYFWSQDTVRGKNNTCPIAVHMETLFNSSQYLWSQGIVRVREHPQCYWLYRSTHDQSTRKEIQRCTAAQAPSWHW